MSIMQVNVFITETDSVKVAIRADRIFNVVEVEPGQLELNVGMPHGVFRIKADFESFVNSWTKALYDN